MTTQLASTTVSGAALLPHDLSPWAMFLSADAVVQTVMLGLAAASVVTWSVWLAKTIELYRSRRRARSLLVCLEGSRGLVDAVKTVAAVGPETVLVRAAMAEARLSAGLPPDGVKERVASKLERLEAAAGRRMAMGIGILATIGSVAPFVGLFGTVWGIMNSFVGISKAQTTNLAVVAPGIAEALLATAIGLIAAIPAVVIYNAFARSIAGYKATLSDVSSEVLRIVSRDLDRNMLSLHEAAE
ncbi:tonB-system energizer ExbB [Telmatospirillum siberiense]|uniref:Biopolymer transport protein ExbB n=1 Tax=Telmatospirillum siberiense TaxID=382514 RepID=A0A2N3PUD3_9PROT|nr:tonB-system energizer ExbB [Telmatospirillum siberiense]PKU24005.1 tonB-system energizer ExbB [Telmatospirillum siberiense]